MEGLSEAWPTPEPPRTQRGWRPRRMAMVSVSEFRISSSMLGVVAALASIVFAGLQQLLCRHYQKQYDMPSNTLLAKTAFAQGVGAGVVRAVCAC